jgi:hypothetical protein
MGVERQADLLEVVRGARPCRGFADLLNGGKQQPDQDRDDRDDHEQLDQREAALAGAGCSDAAAAIGSIHPRPEDCASSHRPLLLPVRRNRATLVRGCLRKKTLPPLGANTRRRFREGRGNGG